MIFVELPVIWKREFTEEDRKANELIYGEDEKDWPDAEPENGRCVFDIEGVERFNPDGEGNTLIQHYSLKYIVRLPFTKFKSILAEHLDTQIKSYAV